MDNTQKQTIETYRKEMLRLHAEKLSAEEAVDPTMKKLLGIHDLATSSEIEEMLSGVPCYWGFEAGCRVSALQKKEE